MFQILAQLRQNSQWYLTLLTVVLMAVTVTFGLPYALRVWRDVKEGPEDESPDPEDVLGPLTHAFAAGEISREEYERIRDSVSRATASRAPGDVPTGKLEGPPEHAAPPSVEIEEERLL